MATYFHGTTQRGLDAILNGAGKHEGPWSCSDQDRMSYLWDAEAMIDGEGFDDADGVIRQAFESAQVQAAVLGEDTTLYVLELEFSPDDVDPDCSCENMHYAVTISEERVTRSAIVRAYRNDFSKWDAPFILSGLVGRDHFSESSVADERLLTLATVLQSQGVYRDDISEFDWNEYSLPSERKIAA